MSLQDNVKVGIVIYLIIVTLICAVSITSNIWQYINYIELKDQVKYYQTRIDLPIDELLNEMGIGNKNEFKIEE